MKGSSSSFKRKRKKVIRWPQKVVRLIPTGFVHDALPHHQRCGWSSCPLIFYSRRNSFINRPRFSINRTSSDGSRFRSVGIFFFFPGRRYKIIKKKAGSQNEKKKHKLRGLRDMGWRRVFFLFEIEGVNACAVGKAQHVVREFHWKNSGNSGVGDRREKEEGKDF